MPEFIYEAHASTAAHPLLNALHIEKKSTGQAIGVLVLCGQGPVQDSATKVKIGEQDKLMPGSVQGHEANIWMEMIARAAGELDRTGEVGELIASGGNSRSGTYKKGETIFAPTEAQLMQDIVESVYGTYAPQSDNKFTQAAMEKNPDDHNTLDNFLNAIRKIDELKRERNEKGLPEDPNLDNVWFMVSHFHLPRMRVLASYFGIDPLHILSAEETALAASKNKKQSPRQEAFQALIMARMGRPVVDSHADYYQRKLTRGMHNLDHAIYDYLERTNVPIEERVAKKDEIRTRLYVEEQKSASMRIREERKWVRGLAMEADYILPYGQSIRDDDRLKNFLLKFNDKQLGKYGLDRNALDISAIRVRMSSEDWKKNRWDYHVVQPAWENEEYPVEVKERLRQLGLPESDIEALSNAEVPPIIKV